MKKLDLSQIKNPKVVNMYEITGTLTTTRDVPVTVSRVVEGWRTGIQIVAEGRTIFRDLDIQPHHIQEFCNLRDRAIIFAERERDAVLDGIGSLILK